MFLTNFENMYFSKTMIWWILFSPVCLMCFQKPFLKIFIRFFQARNCEFEIKLSRIYIGLDPTLFCWVYYMTFYMTILLLWTMIIDQNNQNNSFIHSKHTDLEFDCNQSIHDCRKAPILFTLNKYKQYKYLQFWSPSFLLNFIYSGVKGF